MTKLTAQRLGDFYEFFEDDAVVVARELGIVITKNRLGQRITGVPAWRFHNDREALEARGFQVVGDAAPGDTLKAEA